MAEKFEVRGYPPTKFTRAARPPDTAAAGRPTHRVLAREEDRPPPPPRHEEVPQPHTTGKDVSVNRIHVDQTTDAAWASWPCLDTKSIFSPEVAAEHKLGARPSCS